MKITIKNTLVALIFNYAFMLRLTEKWGLKGPASTIDHYVNGGLDEFEKHIDIVECALEVNKTYSHTREDIGDHVMLLPHRQAIAEAFIAAVNPPADTSGETEGKQTPAIPLETK